LLHLECSVFWAVPSGGPSPRARRGIRNLVFALPRRPWRKPRIAQQLKPYLKNRITRNQEIKQKF
jgi:hypothetical protein